MACGTRTTDISIPTAPPTRSLPRARKRGADVVLRNPVLELQPVSDGTWKIVTRQGTITAEHVVNAAGLWARKVGAMAGVDLPVVPMEHHYLVTEAVPALGSLDREIPTMVDLEGFTYARQEGRSLLLGVYERDPKHWHEEGAPWDFGAELIPEDIDRISPELSLGFERYPVLQGHRHQALGQRALHLHSGWQSARRSGAWAAELLVRLRRHGRLQPVRGRPGWPWRAG